MDETYYYNELISDVYDPTPHCFRVKQLVIVFEIFDFQLRFIENKYFLEVNMISAIFYNRNSF